LLELRKQALVACCEAAGVAFVRDPSNDDPRFARTRLRALLPLLAAEGLDAPALARLARRARQVEEALEAQTSAAAARLGLTETGSCDARAWLAEPIEIRQRLLNAAIARIGGSDASRVGLEKIEATVAALSEAIAAGRRFSANLAGALARSDGKGVLFVENEPARRAGAPSDSPDPRDCAP
jgi:tRNA(Ile)-lysidine synthase